MFKDTKGKNNEFLNKKLIFYMIQLIIKLKLNQLNQEIKTIFYYLRYFFNFLI